jgi:hypothetical protein
VAKQQGDDSIARPWSKHSVGSSAYNKKNEVEPTKKKGEAKESKEDVEGKK